MNVEFYKEQLEAKEAMLVSTTRYLLDTKRLLEEKNTELTAANKDIFASIKFAELIQNSLLPNVDLLKIFLKDATYKIIQQIGIGGDTIFAKNISQGIVFGLLDSTGHGVPAAMLSIAGSLSINELTSTMEINSPSVLLKLLNYQLNTTFRNNDNSIAHMEGTIFYYSAKTKQLTYSSAKGKVLHIDTENNITELKVTKKSIGENTASEFDNYTIDFKTGDKLFLYSDGLTDQFGGEKNKKFSKARLISILKQSANKSVSEINEIVEKEHLAWKKNNHQTDDLSYMVIEL